jgi:hypothetical protein
MKHPMTAYRGVVFCLVASTTVRREFFGAVLTAVVAVAACGRKGTTEGLSALLLDAESKKPVPAVRLLLALKKEGNECSIDTSLTAVSNDNGDVRIPNVKPGEYVVLQSPSRIIDPQLQGKVVTWGGSATGYSFSFGPVLVKKGKMVVTPHGELGIANGYMEGHIVPGNDGVLGISTTAEGALLTVRVPGSGTSPFKIEINTNSDGSGGDHVAQSPAVSDDFEDRGVTFFQRSARLEWQKQPDQRLMMWEEGKAYCNALSLGGSGWRMPTKDELLALAKGKPSGGAPLCQRA